MSINKNKPIHKGFVFLKKRFPVVLTLSNGLFIHLLACNAHQVSNECPPEKRLTLFQTNHDRNSFNELRIEKLQKPVIEELGNFYKAFYEKIYGGDAAVPDTIKEPKQLIYDIQELIKQWKFRILEKEEDLLKTLLKRFLSFVNHMNSVNYNTDSVIVIRDLDLLGKGFYEAYYGVDIVSSNAYRPGDNRISNLKRLYKLVSDGYHLQTQKNKELITKKIDILYQIVKTIYKAIEQSIINCEEKNKAAQKYKIDWQKINKSLDKPYEIFCKEICKCGASSLEVLKLNIYKPLIGMEKIIRIRLNKLDQAPKEIDDFLRNSSIMFDSREVNREHYDDWQRSTKALYKVLGVNVSGELKSDKRKSSCKRKKRSLKAFFSKKQKSDTTTETAF